MIIDLHCDTFMKMYRAGDGIDTFAKNKYNIDIEKLKQGNVLAQCFAVFNYIDKEYITKDMYDKIDYMLKGLNKFSDDVYIYSGYDDLVSKRDAGKICAIPTIEDLGPILSDISNIDRLHEMGFKIMSFTWNHINTLGYPNSYDKNIMSKGLKDFGIEVLERMNELNIIADVSHLSDGGFYDVAKISKKPFVATHSNAREITNHPRNLTDEMIKILSDAGGITGLNFCHTFLCDDGETSRVDDMIRHIKHIHNVGGIDCIAIGSDFDGIRSKLEIYDASAYFLLFNGLKKAGFTQNDIDKITHENALRVLKESE